MIEPTLRYIFSTCIPHDNAKTVCPPGPVPRGPSPPIIVSSLMRSGTHLTIDLLLNNLSSYRNNPLYIDFDRFVYEAHDPNTLTNAGSCIIKTHFRQRPFNQETLKLLESIASNGLVIIPTRDLAAAQASMKKWNFSPSLEKLQKDHDDQLIFWSSFNPLIIDFKDLLNPTKAISFLQDVRQRLRLPDSESH